MDNLVEVCENVEMFKCVIIVVDKVCLKFEFVVN